MPPLNPFLRAFFKSAIPAQCQPIADHILLVPTTEALLYAKDLDSNQQYHELCSSEEFLSCHVLHAHAFGGDVGSMGNMRETKAKPKQYSTINGKSVIIRDNFVFSNKGFKTLNQAQLLHDVIYYPDSMDGQQWLVFYISRPLLGNFQNMPIMPAIISDEPSKERKKLLAEATGEAASVAGHKKDIKNFGEVLSQFPMISRQMQTGIEDILRTFMTANDKPMSKTESRRSSISSHKSTPSISDSISSIKSSLSGSTMLPPTQLELEPEEQNLRTGLENAVTSAIDLFQTVDKTQLSLLGASTKLTGPLVERMIERYIMEQVHDQTVFNRICAIRKPEDSDLEHKLRRMCDVDIAQVGIPIEDGMLGKRALASRLKHGVEVFRKMGVSSSPQEMLEILLATQKAVVTTTNASNDNEKEPAPLNIDADLLVSMILIVVIRSGVRHLHSRLLYMRYFIFIDDVETGERGYALATFEAVLMHLSSDSRTLRRASKKNRQLWQAAKTGDVKELAKLLDPGASPTAPIPEDTETSDDPDGTASLMTDNASLNAPEQAGSSTHAGINGSLRHVYPFESPPTPPPERVDGLPIQRKKRVSMAPRSQSQSSSYSSLDHVRTRSIDSINGPPSDDLTIEKLAQTQDSDGNSVVMMSIEAKHLASLRFLLSQPEHFGINFLLTDMNDTRTTLLSAALQVGDHDITTELVYHLEENASSEQVENYLAIQDENGRSAAHYLFNQPSLIEHLGDVIPWTLKDKNGQTPLFALCRSYDHESYKSMVEMALNLATRYQGDGQRLHLDDHVDSKGNTLLHIVNEPRLTRRLLQTCDSDVNSANDKRFTPLMVGSKYGRIDLVRVLFADPRADITLRDWRGFSALELAKDDDIRNQIDDLILLSARRRDQDRVTTIVRSFFVEDGSIRVVLKSGAYNFDGSVTVSTCRRSLQDFENLAGWLSTECPASWLPSNFNMPSPYVIPSKPSRTVLRDTQLRLNAFFQALLSHTTFSTHEMVWEFFVVPDLDPAMLAERSRRKAEARVDNVRDDFEPVTDTTEVDSFVVSAKDQVQRISQATRKVIRTINLCRMRSNDVCEALLMNSNAAQTLLFLPQSHLTALDRVAKLLQPSDAAPMNALYYTFRCTLTSALALQNALDRPGHLVGSMMQIEKAISRGKNSLTRANRWTPNLALFEDAKRAVAADAWQKEAKSRRELETLGCELRYTMVTVASELAGWQAQRATEGRQMLRDLAKNMVIREKAKLESMQRVLRTIRADKH